jgi:hypothetical protein
VCLCTDPSEDSDRELQCSRSATDEMNRSDGQSGRMSHLLPRSLGDSAL